jgi:hypothetical protein
MEDALGRCHTFKHLFVLGRAGREAKANAIALKMELLKNDKVDEETNAETAMPSKTRCDMNTWRDSISHKINVAKEFDADIIFPRIHLMSHWVEQI